ncbi:Nudix hydrolase 8 [Geodia barretti]|uniref:Nudix hydrolase 8 n=1 Tax=Geodia barretti TaxID=519541 RepID=A0AA35SEW3_GEOBA|nr:Nudix hydrolase 8 [Geodia barretti]
MIMAASSAPVQDSRSDVFQADTDQFKGVILTPQHYGLLSPTEFERRLQASLAVWQEEGRRGVWVKIPLTQSELVPSAAKLGLQFHHAHCDHLMMTKWLPTSEPNNLPDFAHHYIGVAGFVVNAEGQVLLVQEKWLKRLSLRHWKLPGGHTEKGEELWETAIRETFEETGVKTEFVAMLCFRHMHEYRWGTDDIYFVCLLRPLTTDITVNPAEIAEAKWTDVNAYIGDPETTTTNRLIAQSYKDGLASGSFIQPVSFPHFFANKKDLVFYSNRPLDEEDRRKEKSEPHTKL